MGVGGERLPEALAYRSTLARTWHIVTHPNDPEVVQAMKRIGLALTHLPLGIQLRDETP